MINFYKEQPNFNCYRGQMLRLLPNQLMPYRIHIKLPHKRVYIDIISSFDNKIAYSFRADVNNGVLELKNLQYNDYYDVILKISLPGTFVLYSEPIKISDYKKELTTLVHYYKDNELLSFNAPIYFRENMINGELNTYYEVSNLQTVSYFKSLSKFEKYNTELINKDVLLRLIELFRCNNVYFDLNKVNLFEFPDIADCEGDAGFTQTDLMITKLNEKLEINNFIVTENKTAYVVTEQGLIREGLTLISNDCNTEGMFTLNKFYEYFSEIINDEEYMYMFDNDGNKWYIGDLEEYSVCFEPTTLVEKNKIIVEKQ